MLSLSPVWTMIALDVIMVVYTMWVFSLKRPLGRLKYVIPAALFSWLFLLHLGLSNQAIFSVEVSRVAFLLTIFAFVAVVGAILIGVPSLRSVLLGLDQRQLMLLQGVRVFFGATFLMQASIGALPQAFGVLDGYTHISAGFFGLVAAFLVAASIQSERRLWFANVFGLVDILVVASSLALILLPEIGPHHSMMYAVFLPAPLWFWFHVVSMWKLLNVKPLESGETQRV